MSIMTTAFPSFNLCTVAVIGLGYVGLPLAVQFSKPGTCPRTSKPLKRRVIGFDVNNKRLSELRNGVDRTNEISSSELYESTNLSFSNDPSDLSCADVFVITVPTPIDSAKQPDLSPLKKASATVGLALEERAKASKECIPIVIYESTVFPGATEEVCVPILEEMSGLTYNVDFVCGYSPERINPGDKKHTLTSIVKVTSGSTQPAATWIDSFYGSIITAGTHQAASIKVAEAAKVIENTQRDINIALINELSIIFSKLGIDTIDVLEAAGSKWNFLPFRPGLVGGHCIGVDPYYLTHRAEQAGYRPEVVLAGRRINDRMGEWIAEQIILKMAQNNIPVGGSRVLILGITFKENCPDLRNTKVIDIINTLKRYSITTTVSDPWACPEEAYSEYGINLTDRPINMIDCEAIIVAVAHDQYISMGLDEWSSLAQEKIILDIKGLVPREIRPVRI